MDPALEKEEEEVNSGKDAVYDTKSFKQCNVNFFQLTDTLKPANAV
jgi:hypothetical protein